MRITFEKLTCGIQEMHVAKFEAKHGIQLPTDYRQFLIQYNVCLVHPTDLIRAHYKSWKGKTRRSILEGWSEQYFVIGDIVKFLGLNPKPEDPYAEIGLIEWSDEFSLDLKSNFKEQGRRLEIAVGRLEMVSIGIERGDFGKVFLESYAEQEDMEWHPAIVLADSFSEFIESLEAANG